MKTLFAMGFRPAQDLWNNRSVSGRFLGGPSLGRPLAGWEIDEITAKITKGRQQMSQIQSWIESKKVANPFNWTLFDDPVKQQNFYDIMAIATDNQSNADKVWSMIQNPASADYDIPDEDLWRANEWAQAVNAMYVSMQQYGGPAPAAGPTGPVSPFPSVLPTGGKKPATVKPPGAAVPGMAPAPQPMILGVPQNTFLLGGGVLAIAGILAYGLLK